VTWKKRILATVVIGLGLAAALAGAAYVVVHTRAFNRFALAKVIEEAQNATGGRVAIQRLEIHWSRLGVDFYGLSLYADQGASQPPVLRASHLGAGLKIISILKRRINLSELVLDEPVLDLRVNAHGETNLPKPPPSKKPSDPIGTVFNLAIGHLLVNSGQIDYRDQQLPLSADLRDFRSDIRFSILSAEYKGSLGYSHGRVETNNFSPIEHGARITFAASRSELDIDPLVLTLGNSRLTAHAKLVDYTNPGIQGDYEAVLFTKEIGQILKNPALPAGQVSISGSLRYKNSPNASFLNSAYVDGRLSSPQLRLNSGQVSADLKSIRGAFQLKKGSLRLQGLEADLLQGHLSANGEVSDLAGRSSTRLAAVVKSISLEAVSNALPPGSYDRLHFTGRASADMEASWSGSVENIVAHSRIAIAAPAQPQAANGRIPLNGTIDVRYDGARGTASFGQSHLQTGATQLTLTGTLSRQSNLTVLANTSDLREVSALVSEIQAATAKPSAAALASNPFDIRGSAQVSAQITGSVKNPSLRGELLASNLQVEGSRWRSLRADIAASPSRITLQNAALVSAQQGRLDFSAQAGLDHWSFTPSSPISGDVKAADLNIADLERLAKLHYPFTGTLSVNVTVRGSEQNLAGQGSLQIVKASAFDEPITKLGINFQGSGNTLQSTAQLQVPAGTVEAKLTFSPQSGQYQASVNTAGLKLAQINAVQSRDLGIAGLLTASASGSGTFKDLARDSQLSAHLQIAQLHVHEQVVSDAEAQLTLARQHANFTLHSVIAQGNVDAKGDVELAGEYQTTATIDVRALPIGPLLASYVSGGQPGLQGQTEIHAEMAGPLKETAQIQAHVEIPSFNLTYQAMSIALVRPLRLDYHNGVATLQQTELKGTGTDLTLQGVIPIKGASTAFRIAANGNMDLSILQTMAKGVKSSGRVELALTGRGSDFNHPAMQGHLRIQNAYLSTDSVPVGIEGVNGMLNISGNRVEVGQLTGTVGGGTISAQGSMVYGSQTSFDLSMRGTSVRVRYPEGLRSIVNCNLRLNGTTADSTLSGRVVVDRLSFTQQFDLATFVSQFNGSTVASAPSPVEQNMKLSVAIQSAQDLNLVNGQLSLQGSASLNLTGTIANPVVLGRTTLTGGDIYFLGKRYEVQNGAIEFSNPVHTEPLLNLYVATTVDQYNITLNFIGPAGQLRTTYTSDPPLPPADIINLLALGQTAEESAQSTTSTTSSAESIVASGAASQVSGKIQKLTGISELTIDPMAGNNQVNPGSQVAIQQRVTGNILLTFSTDVTSTQATTVQLQYRTSRQTSVTVLRDQNGGYAIDLRLHKTF
jgi:translocation and assembly module TamB